MIRRHSNSVSALRSFLLVCVTGLATGSVMALQFGFGLAKFGGTPTTTGHGRDRACCAAWREDPDFCGKKWKKKTLK